MKIITKALIVFGVVTFLIVGFILTIYFREQQLIKPLETDLPKIAQDVSRDSELDSIAGYVRYYDEVLTMSARNYAFTGDIKWKNRYETNAPLLDDKIKTAIAKGDTEDKKNFDSIDAANIALVKMEETAMTDVAAGDKTAAIAILDGPEYANQKQIYQDGLQRYFESRGKKLDETLTISSDLINKDIADAKNVAKQNTWMIFGLLGFMILIMAVLYYYIKVYLISSLTQLNQATKDIAAGNLDRKIEIKSNDETGQVAESFNKMVVELKQSRENIESKIRERTAELEKAKHNIEEAKIKDEAYLSSIGDGVGIVDANGNVLRVNHAAEEMLGRHDLVGKNFASEIKMVDKNGKELPVGKRPIHRLFETGKKATYTDYAYIKSDGTKLPIALTTAPVIVNDNIIAAIDVFRDISKERQIDQAKTEFVSLASHQLRTPLSAINWYAEMLLAGDVGKLTADQKKYLQEIYNGNQRMVDLVNALLDVSRIELGTFAIEPIPTDIKKITQSLISEMQKQIKKKNLKISESYDSKISKINVDPKLMRIILQNIISNAVKYTPEKGKVAVILTRKEPNVLIKVTDTGFGIPKAQQPHIFEKLFRADNVREKDTEGTGLGLYLVKSIVDQSGGKVWFESAENKGTTFFVQLPLSGMKKKEGTKALEDVK